MQMWLVIILALLNNLKTVQTIKCENTYNVCTSGTYICVYNS